MAGRGIVAQAQAVAASMTTHKVSVKPSFSKSYEPYAVHLVGYDVTGDVDALKGSLERLRENFPAGDPAEIKKMVTFLMANTKRRAEHDLAEHLLRAGLCAVAGDYPVRIVTEVIEGWHKLDGSQAIFTPVQAELYRALEAAAAPVVLLDRELTRLIQQGGNHG